MNRGVSKNEAVLAALLIAVLIWIIWYHFNYGTIDFARLFGFGQW
ncbi:MAG: hypothetical protein P4L61_03735 [Candidatus Pacebacteria bacterium]|nr:hypothetical protein [Candidatus Paceibacterota bacterium]